MNQIDFLQPKYSVNNLSIKIDEAGHIRAFFGDSEYHSRERILSIAENIGNLPGATGKDPFPLFHSFADGMYTREVHVPKDALIVGVIHRNEYFVNVLKGRILIMSEFGSKEIIAPNSFVAKAGVKHIGYALEDTVWIDTHKTDKTNVEDAEKDIFADSYEDLDIGNNVIDGYSLVISELGFTEEEVRQLTENTSDMIFKKQENVMINKSDIEGMGVFVTKDFREGDTVGVARINNKRTLIGRYTNHSSNPNTKSLIKDNEAIFIATKNIPEGDEVTIDYRNARYCAKELDERLV